MYKSYFIGAVMMTGLSTSAFAQDATSTVDCTDPANAAVEACLNLPSTDPTAITNFAPIAGPLGAAAALAALLGGGGGGGTTGGPIITVDTTGTDDGGGGDDGNTDDTVGTIGTTGTTGTTSTTGTN